MKEICKIQLWMYWEVDQVARLQHSRQGASSAKWGVQCVQFAKYATIYAIIRNETNMLNTQNMQINRNMQVYM